NMEHCYVLVRTFFHPGLIEYSKHCAILQASPDRIAWATVMNQATANIDADSLALPTISHRLLIVDDDRVHRMVLARVARQAGYEVEEAGTYETARPMMREGAHDCVTLDLS